jgi:polar amino acid transport system substrate-binding protein
MNASLRAALAPKGHLRVSLNMANPVLTRSHTTADKPAGITIDLSRKLARRLGVDLEFLSWRSPGESVQALAEGLADVGYLAWDPNRAAQIQFTAPYAQIEACYMVHDESPLRDHGEVDRPGTSVLVIATSAYDLYLSRNLQHTIIVRLASGEEVLQHLLDDTTRTRVAAGIKQALLADVRRMGGLRLLDGHFMAIRQAMVLPPGASGEAHAAAGAFMQDMVSSGFIAESVSRHQIAGITLIHADTSKNF